MMDDMTLRMMGLASGSVDIFFIITFIAFGIIYFLTPVIGYQEKRPFGLTAALYLLVFYLVATILQLLANWTSFDGGIGVAPQRGQNQKQWNFHYHYFFAFVKLALYTLSLYWFVIGLSGLRLRKPAAVDVTPTAKPIDPY